MRERTVFVNATAITLIDHGVGNITVTIIDQMTQRDYSVIVPLHLLGALHDVIAAEIRLQPDLFPAADVRLLQRWTEE